MSKWLFRYLLKSHPLFKQLHNFQQQQRQKQEQGSYESYKSKSGKVEVNVKKEGKRKTDSSIGEYIDYEEV